MKIVDSPTAQLHMLDNLLAITRQFLAGSSSQTHIYTLDQAYPYIALKPQESVVPNKIKRCLDLTSSRTDPLLSAILQANQYLQWQQTYGLEDGFDEYFLQHYGWFNLISPDGPFVNDNLRVSFAYWGQGLHYKEHSHEPEETYVVLAGSAVFHSEGRQSKSCGPDDVIHHDSNQRHSIDMRPGPLMVMAVWRGQNLTAKPKL